MSYEDFGSCLTELIQNSVRKELHRKMKRIADEIAEELEEVAQSPIYLDWESNGAEELHAKWWSDLVKEQSGEYLDLRIKGGRFQIRASLYDEENPEIRFEWIDFATFLANQYRFKLEQENVSSFKQALLDLPNAVLDALGVSP